MTTIQDSLRLSFESAFRKASGCGAGVIGNPGFESGNDCAKLRSRMKAEVSTPQFRRWFGASKIVDEHGNPLICYRGSRSNETDLRGTETFVDNPGVASVYAAHVGKLRYEPSSNLKAVYLKIEKPYRMDAYHSVNDFVFDVSMDSSEDQVMAALHEAFSAESDFEAVSESGNRSGMVLRELIAATKPGGPESLRLGEFMVRYNQYQIESFAYLDSPKVRECLRRAGYDGAVFDDPLTGGASNTAPGLAITERDFSGAFRPDGLNHRSYRVFGEGQVKSAIGNSGDFSVGDNRIEKRFTLKNCGSGSPGDPGFQADNDCAKGDGSSRKPKAKRVTKASLSKKLKELSDRAAALDRKLWSGYSYTRSEIQSTINRISFRAHNAVMNARDMTAGMKTSESMEYVLKVEGLVAHVERVKRQWEYVLSSDVQKELEVLMDDPVYRNLRQSIPELQALKDKYDEAEMEHYFRVRAPFDEFSKVVDEFRAGNKTETEVEAARKVMEKAVDDSLAMFDDLRREHSKAMWKFKDDVMLPYDKQCPIEAVPNFTDSAVTMDTRETALKNANHVVDQIQPYLAKSVYGESLEIGVSVEKQLDRAHYMRSKNSMVLSVGAPVSVYAHELGHHLEYENPAVQMLMNMYRGYRVMQSKTEDVHMATAFPDHGYKSGEYGNPDSFGGTPSAAAYTGKVYDHGATEILSMGLERFYGGAHGLAENDFEYFTLVTSVLTGRYFEKVK